MKQQTRSRLTVDMTFDEHTLLKMASAKLGLSMRELMLQAVFEKLEEIEDEWLAVQANEILKRIESGQEKTVPFDEYKKSK